MSEQPKSDVQLCCEALAAAQQVWLESEQAQRATSSGQPSEVDELRQQLQDADERIASLTQQRANALEAQQILGQRVVEITRLLENLTPGGSEFVGDPERCARWVAEHMSSTLQQAVTASGERNQLRQRVVELERELGMASGARDYLQAKLLDAEQERDQGYMLVAWLNDDSPSGIDTQLVCRVLGLPYPDLEPLLALVADIEARGRALVEERSKQG